MQFVLHQYAEGFNFIGNEVHPYFPFQWAQVIHAARISMAFQANSRAASAKTNVKQTWPAYIAGYLVMTWGGSVITHQLLGLPPPQLFSFSPYIVYITTHLVMTLLFRLFPSAPSLLPVVDTILFPLDATVRVGAVISGTSHLYPDSKTFSSVNPVLSNSMLSHMIIGAFASAGGGLSASTLSTWSPTWSFSTPSFLQAPTMAAFYFASMDLWAGAMVAALYGLLTGHAAWMTLRNMGLIVLVLTGGIDAMTFDTEKVMTPMQGKAFAAMVLAGFFGLRAVRGLWLSRSVAVIEAKQRKDAAKAKKQ